jgi:hypothetical protein
VTENQSTEIREIRPGRGGSREGAGRPAGAPNKIARPVKALAASYGPASIARLVQLRDGAASEQVRFAAARELLDRAYGRPRQEIDLNGGQSLTIIVQRERPPPDRAGGTA